MNWAFNYEKIWDSYIKGKLRKCKVNMICNFLLKSLFDLRWNPQGDCKEQQIQKLNLFIIYYWLSTVTLSCMEPFPAKSYDML